MSAMLCSCLMKSPPRNARVGIQRQTSFWDFAATTETTVDLHYLMRRSWRWASFNLLTFKQKLAPESPLFPLLSPLRFMDFHVGEDDLTCDKDWKHIFKRFRNLLLRHRGVVVNGFRITPDIIRTHFKSNGLS